MTTEDQVEHAKLQGIVDGTQAAIRLVEVEATKAFLAKRDGEAGRWRSVASDLRQRIEWAQTKLVVYDEMAIALDSMRSRRG